jgi:hypothetical protein
MSEQEDIKAIQETWNTFMSQFGKNDFATNIVLEEFFSLLLEKNHEEIVSLPRQTGQEGDQGRQDHPHVE